MATPTYTPLANITLGSSASSVSFSSIPASYRDLILVIDGTATANASLRLQVNADTASNYSFVRAGGNGSTTFSTSVSDNYIAVIWSNLEFGTTKSNAIVQIMDYSATDKHKTALVRENQNNPSGPAVTMYAGRWANTAAITQLRVFTATNSIAAATTISLYGIAS